MSLDSKLQIAAIMHATLPQITCTIKVKSIQQQENGSECGVFAIASALEPCAGNDPTKSLMAHRPATPTLGDRSVKAGNFFIPSEEHPKRARQVVQDGSDQDLLLL